MNEPKPINTRLKIMNLKPRIEAMLNEGYLVLEIFREFKDELQIDQSGFYKHLKRLNIHPKKDNEHDVSASSGSQMTPGNVSSAASQPADEQTVVTKAEKDPEPNITKRPIMTDVPDRPRFKHSNQPDLKKLF
ncbi:MAG: hypothetical protein KDJ38_00070 [Gammaproteobacteria bacterium]|nr:hypothetical protein [Gammaproteobacteria bacterium]